jgi:hypothetical protein
MEPSEIGPYVLLTLGAFAVAAAIVGHFRQLPMKSALLLWIFGVALLGIGSYGPAFLADYVGFVQALNRVTETPGADQVADFLAKADKAGLSTNARKAILVESLGRDAAASGRPAAATAAVFEKVAKSLPPKSENLAVLEETRIRVDAEVAVRDLANRHVEAMAVRPDAVPTVPEAAELAPLLRLRDDQLRAMRIDPETLTRAKARSEGG